ncbi:MAG: hypothetical protein GX265_00280 [Mollicutes bacterium]|nr:hypothetical protein [Mollicutes bacterium]
MKRGLLIFALVVAFIYSVGGIYFYFFGTEKIEPVKNISLIEEYGYNLKSNATELMKTEFDVLKANLESDTIDEEAYALSIAKLFIIDLYTMNNKINKYDIGGIEYVYPSGVDNYKLKLTDTLYKYLEENSTGKREQELPEVVSINIENIEEIEYELEKIKYPGYKVTLKWDYLKDLEYDTTGKVIVIKKDNKYYITEKK